jgi:hypothetical protein
MTATAASVTDITAEPGTLRPQALWTIEVLFHAPGRTLAAWRVARQIGDDDALHVVPLMQDMAALGLVGRVGPGIGYQSRWRLLVEGPVQKFKNGDQKGTSA